MLFITIMTKCLIQRKRSTKYDKSSPKLKQGATGTMGSGAAARSRGAGVTARKKELPSGPWLSARRGGRASALTRDWGEGG